MKFNLPAAVFDGLALIAVKTCQIRLLILVPGIMLLAACSASIPANYTPGNGVQ